MNTINVEINFTKGTNKLTGINLITGDYASTKMVFQFDRTDGTKVLEMKNPSGEVVFFDEIINNEVLLSAFDEGLNYSIFNEEGRYIYEVSLYNGDSKLTSVKGELPVQKEQVIIDGEIVEPYLPYFDRLMQQLDTAITETNNLDISASKVDTTTTITITHKDGTTQQVLVLDGEKGDKGDKGDAGAIKMIIVNSLPTTGEEDTIYLVPITGETGNNYEEYVYVNNQWEKLGGIQVEVDLTDYVKNTDYATASKGGVIKGNVNGFQVQSSGTPYAETRTYASYSSGGNALFISKGTLENVITGKGLTTKSYVDGLVGDIASALDTINGEVI